MSEGFPSERGHRLRAAQIYVVGAAGLVLPYLSRIPGELQGRRGWLAQYLSGGVGGVLLLELFNVIAVGVAVLLTARYHRRLLWLLSVVPGYAFLWVAHSSLNLAGDAQAAVALVFIPLFSLVIFGPCALLSEGIHRYSAR